MKLLEFNSTSFQGRVYCLTSVIEALQTFQGFDSSIKRLAIALHARELSMCELHFYVIAHLAGLGGAR